VGDAACHLDSVCLSCGRFVEGVDPGGRCPHCDDPDGLGESMMVEARRHAVAMGLSRIVLCTEPDMGAAHRLYGRLGYRRQPERDWTVGGYELISYGCEVDPVEERQ
jgi:hypothetical protein